MITKYIAKSLLIGKDKFILTNLFKALIEFFCYSIFSYFITSNLLILQNTSSKEKIYFSIFFASIATLYKILNKSAYIFRYRVAEDDFSLTLLKPINSILIILMQNIDLACCFVFGVSIILSLIVGLPSSILIVVSGMGISIFIFVLSLSLIIMTNGKIPLEKILVLMFFIPLLSFVNNVTLLIFTILSVGLVIGSLKLWNYLLAKYVK